MLRVVFWSAAVMAATAVIFSILITGALGDGPLSAINSLPGIQHVAKNVYFEEGMIALTNWHQDPGYASAWMNLWAVLAFLASRRGLGSRRWPTDALVVGGLWFGVGMTLSRTGIGVLAIAVAALLWHERSNGTLCPALRLLAPAVAVTVLLTVAIVSLDSTGGTGSDVASGFAFRVTQAFDLGARPEGSAAGGVYDARSEVWPMYLDFFLDNPVRGVGLGTGWATTVQEPHNLLLELLGETGLVGLLGFSALLASILTSSNHHPVGRLALLAALAPAITQTVLFEPAWWLAAGLVVARCSVLTSPERLPAGCPPATDRLPG